MQPGDRLGGRGVTDQRTRGPVFDVVTLTTADWPTHLALVYPAVLLTHAWFTTDLPLHAESRVTPGVPGVAPLVQAEVDRGALVYDTGEAVPLARVLDRLREASRTLGVRATLELVYQVADTLAQAEEGLGAHGQINPWTVALTRQGRPVLLGHGVPCVEFDFDRPTSGFALKEDSLRYAPPERFGPDPVDLRSDVFALWLVAAEGILGRPLYEGVLDDLRHQAKRGDAWSRWYPHRDQVSPELNEWMNQGLKPDWDARRFDPAALVQDLYGLTQRFDAEGATLAEVAAMVFDTTPDVSEALPRPRTGAMRRSQGARTLYDPRTGATPRDAAEEAATEATARPQDHDARKAALRERLKSGPSATTAIHGPTQYVTLDPLTEATSRPSGAIPPPPGARTTQIVERAGDPAPVAPPADLSWRVVTHAGRAVRVAVFGTDQVATVALRAAIEHGALPIDTSGRLLAGYVLAFQGRRLAGRTPARDLPPGDLELVPLAVNLRLVTVQVDTEPPIRFRSPTSLSVPAAWFVAGIVEWLGLPEAPWTAFVDELPVDRDVLLAEVLGERDLVRIRPRLARPGQ